MTIEKLRADMIAAMKAKDKVRKKHSLVKAKRGK